MAPVPLAAEADLQRALRETVELSAAEIRRRFEAGESLADMAATQGASREATSAALRAVLDQGVVDAARRGELPSALASAIGTWFSEQIEILLDLHASEAAPADWTDFGYPCVDITCLVPPAYGYSPDGR